MLKDTITHDTKTIAAAMILLMRNSRTNCALDHAGPFAMRACSDLSLIKNRGSY